MLYSRAFPLAELRTLQTFPQVKQGEGREKQKVECHISPQLEVHESSQSLLSRMRRVQAVLDLLSTLVVLDLVLEGVDKEWHAGHDLRDVGSLLIVVAFHGVDLVVHGLHHGRDLLLAESTRSERWPSSSPRCGSGRRLSSWSVSPLIRCMFFAKSVDGGPLVAGQGAPYLRFDVLERAVGLANEHVVAVVSQLDEAQVPLGAERMDGVTGILEWHRFAR